MKLHVELSDQELEALRLLARGRQVRIVAGALNAAPEDRAIARILLAAEPSTDEVET